MNERTAIALTALLFLAGNALAYCQLGGNTDQGANTDWDKIDAIAQDPQNATNLESPINLVCDVRCDGTATSVNFYLHNDTAVYFTEALGASTCNNDYTSAAVTLDAGEYNWTCDATISTQTEEDLNNTFTIVGRSPSPVDTDGDCLTEKGYSFEYAAGITDDWTLFDLTDLGEYLRNNSYAGVWDDGANMSNVWVEDAVEYYSDSYKLIVDSRTEKAFTVWIGSQHLDYNHTHSGETADATVELELANFTRQNKAYWMDIKFESNASYFNYELTGTHILDVYCDNYAPDRIDLKNTINQSRFLLVTKEQPLFFSEVDGLYNRKYEPYVDNETVTLFILNDSHTTETLDFELEDYLGGYQDSFLRVVRKINATASLETIWQQQWYHLQIFNVTVENNTFYQYVIYDIENDDTRIIAWDEITSSGTKTIVIKDPKFTDQKSYLEGLAVGLTSSYSGSSVGVSYNATVGEIYNLTFTVYNYTSEDNYQEEYTTTISGSEEGSITYVVGNQNASYYVTCSMQTSEYGEVKLSDILTPAVTEERFPMYDAFNLPTNFMGLDKDEWYDGASIFLATAVACVFAAGSVGTGGLIFVAMVGGLKYIQWFRSMTWELWLFMAAMAIAYAFVSNRRKSE